MPRGWSWALHTCSALEHLVRITGTGRDLPRERCEAPLMTVAEPVCSVYLDNINVHSISLENWPVGSVSTKSPEPPDSINSQACILMGSLVFYVMNLAAFKGSTSLFAVSYQWVEHHPGSCEFRRATCTHLLVGASFVIATPSTVSFPSLST